MEEFFKGRKLYGDDFNIEQIKQWYEEESEGYANLGSKDFSKYKYDYHNLNKILGYNKLPNKSFENVLGIGSAWGCEFEPIIDKIKSITIIEPSDNLVSSKIGNIIPKYIKPSIEGIINLEDNSFDLITCFGTLHHIPNVTLVLSELLRILKPNGYLLLREPLNSMGDWRKPRTGLTKNERGIPVAHFDNIFKKNNVSVESKKYCFTMTSFLQRKIGKLFKNALYSYKFYIYIDSCLSKIFKFNSRYFATKSLHNIAPNSIFYVVKK